jgi:hypothetical protein
MLVETLNSHLNLLAEVFHARPAEVEEMIQSRLEEKNSPVECEEVLWPATFRLGEYPWAEVLRA